MSLQAKPQQVEAVMFFRAGAICKEMHLAEFEEGTGREAEALARYEHLLTQRCDAEVHRRAYVLAGRLGQKSKASLHYAAAERLWRAALDLGEVYPLEGLAKLYCDAGRNLEEAVRLAERNLKYKRDASALQTLKRAVESRMRR